MKTAYVFNSDSELIDEGSLSEIAKKLSMPYRSAYYAIVNGSIIRNQNCYLSWNKNFIPKLKIRDKTLVARRLRVKNTKHLLKRSRIIKMREGKNLTREKLATLLGVSANVIWDMENIPFHNPTISVIMRLAKYYDVKIEELVDMKVLKFAQFTIIE